MGPHMVLDHFRHQAGDRAPNPDDLVHDLVAAGLTREDTLERLDLPADAAHPGQQLVLLADRVCHYRVGGYPIRSRSSSGCVRAPRRAIQALVVGTCSVGPAPTSWPAGGRRW